jgi:hypothetical protein
MGDFNGEDGKREKWNPEVNDETFKRERPFDVGGVNGGHS